MIIMIYYKMSNYTITYKGNAKFGLQLSTVFTKKDKPFSRSDV